ncbi:MAG: S-layer homology domain-containing protein, partial [Oscillospiraceae bacterium]|nr:S-layer homology domain-containing protein [Oscillospiraceae bacterium]
AIGADARYVRSDSKQGVVWTVGDTVYASVLNGSELSEPVALYTLCDGGRFAYWDVELDEDGTWSIFADAVSGEEEKSSLVFAQVWPFTDLELQYVYADPAKRSGNDQPVEISAVNRGDTPVTEVNIGIFGDGVDFDENVNCTILPGETWTRTVQLDLSGLTGSRELVAYAEAADEYIYENNYDYVTVGALDAALDLDYYYNGDTVLVTARARNAGPGPAHATITVQEDDENGIILDMKNLGEIATDEDVLYLYEFDLREVNFAGARTKNYYISLETLEEDYNPENNKRYIVIYNDVKPEFTDVDPDAYYAEPVNWAVEYGITNGTSSTTFSPDSTCTRGQIVTFLWRASGCPAPESGTNPFTDVAPDAYYAQAVAWAVEQGITNGTSPTTFSPNSTCTRAQVVTFLYRAMHREESAESFDPARYELVAENVTWLEALEAARAKGGKLVSIDSLEEYRYLLGLILDEGLGDRSFHLGGRRDPNGSSYHWVNAENTHLIGPSLNGPEAWCRDLWQAGEPNLAWNGIPEEALIAYFSEKEGRWVWYDGQKDYIVATRDYGYIIEYDP